MFHPNQSSRLYEANKRSSRSLAAGVLDPDARDVPGGSSLETTAGGSGPRQQASVRRRQGKATRFRGAVAQSEGAGDQGWLGYASDDYMGTRRLTMMEADLQATREEKRATLCRPITSTRREGPRAAPAWGCGLTARSTTPMPD